MCQYIYPSFLFFSPLHLLGSPFPPILPCSSWPHQTALSFHLIPVYPYPRLASLLSSPPRPSSHSTPTFSASGRGHSPLILGISEAQFCLLMALFLSFFLSHFLFFYFFPSLALHLFMSFRLLTSDCLSCASLLYLSFALFYISHIFISFINFALHLPFTLTGKYLLSGM